MVKITTTIIIMAIILLNIKVIYDVIIINAFN